MNGMPFKIDRADKALIVESDGEKVVADVYGRDNRDRWDRAEKIVRAVNMHDGLVEVLERIVNSAQEFLDGADYDAYDLMAVIRDNASEVLAKAKAGAL